MKIFLPHLIISLLASIVIIWFTPLQFDAVQLFTLTLINFTVIWGTFYFYEKAYYRKMIKLLRLIAFFTKELMLANLKVAYDVLTPPIYMHPCIIKFELDAKSDVEITILANMISLTPGTLSLDLSDDRKFLFIHSVYYGENAETVEKLKLNIKNGFEKRLLELTR